MGLLLNIDTASEKAHVSIAREGLILQTLWSDSQKEHASFLQTAILELTQTTGIKLPGIDAVAVTAGPGSYTGLRVGLSSAKGLCYALKKPLITISTLEVLAGSAIELFPVNNDPLLCPMIDARRMEVFTAIYDRQLKKQLEPCAMVLDEHSLEKELQVNRIFFFGSGANKWRSICKHQNATFESVSMLPETMSKLSDNLYFQKQFTELAYSEPLYLKEHQTVIKK